MSVIIDLNAVCLVCLQDDGGRLQSVFSASSSTDEITIAEKIILCSELRPRSEDTKLPDKICARCLDDLTAAWRFRLNCEQANSVFRSLQQQEDEDDVQFHLEVQKLKVPSGLKIKRVQPETKAYLLPLELDKEGLIEEEVAEEELHSVESENADEVEDMDQMGVIERLDDEVVEYEDYYETEEVLEDEEDKECGVKEERISTEEKDALEDAEEMAVGNEEKSEQRKSARASSRVAAAEAQTKVKSEPESSKRGRQRTKKPEEDEEYIPVPNAPQEKESHKKPPLHGPAQKVRRAEGKGPGKGHRHHPSMKICELCGNVYKYQHALNAHMRRHTNDRQFGCELCDKAFVSNVELRRHMRVHTGQKPYACAYCDRRFSDFGSRRKHERTHTGERPYQCSTCNKAFAYAHVLSVHLLTHTGEKKFQCTQCGKGFTKKSYLLSHMQLHARASNVDEQQMLPVKAEQLTDCIFTTRYVITDVDGELSAPTVIASSAMKLEDGGVEHITEEQLVDEGESGDFMLGMR